MTSVLNDIKQDLDGMPADLWADVKKLVEDAKPAVGSTLNDARARGAALGATLAGHVPDQVIDRMPDAISDRLPATGSGRSRGRKLLIFGGLAAAAAVAAAVWMRRGSAPVPSAGAYPPAPAQDNRTWPAMEDDALDLPANGDKP
jgi:uncharacterized membrane protein YebE (DUF533 family)